MRSSIDLQQFRNDFIKNFQRIGMNTTPGDARFLRILIESSRAKNGLEIGVATGYGAIVMGLGFERNKGHLTSIDIDAEMVATARANIRKMELQKTVTVVKGAALKVIPRLDGPFDFVFIDAWKAGVSGLPSGGGAKAQAEGDHRGRQCDSIRRRDARLLGCRAKRPQVPVGCGPSVEGKA